MGRRHSARRDPRARRRTCATWARLLLRRRAEPGESGVASGDVEMASLAVAMPALPVLRPRDLDVRSPGAVERAARELDRIRHVGRRSPGPQDPVGGDPPWTHALHGDLRPDSPEIVIDAGGIRDDVRLGCTIHGCVVAPRERRGVPHSQPAARARDHGPAAAVGLEARRRVALASCASCASCGRSRGARRLHAHRPRAAGQDIRPAYCFVYVAENT